MLHRQSGNVLFAVFGAIALVGVLSASMMTFMKGPLATSVKLTKMTTAESQMTIGAQVAVMATAAQANNGDCDTDGYVEPMEWRTPTTEPVPTGGGLVPLSLGITKKDPWGTEYGYCVWNHGPTLTGAGCNANMLQGYNSNANTVVALISAGPDKTFTTTCRDFATADVVANGALTDPTDLPLVSKAAETDDDIIKTFTYQEATGASGGLWNLKTGDPATAVISKNIEATGTASLQGGVLLPDKSLITCDATTAGIMARNGTSGIEICDGSAWQAISGGAAGGSGLVLTPNNSNGMNVNGTCGTATCYSANTTFTITNNLTPAATSDTLVVTLTNTANFEKVSDNCNGNTIAAGATCQIVVRAKATGNTSYTGMLTITGNNSPFATLDGTASSFPACNAGGQTTGGYFVGCGVSGAYDLIITPSGCTGGPTNPTCAGGADTQQLQMVTINATIYSGTLPPIVDALGSTGTTGAQQTATIAAYGGGIYVFPAVEYCNSLVYAGYDDWFLPSVSEFQTYVYPHRVAVNMNTALNYWSSNPWSLSDSMFTRVAFDSLWSGSGVGTSSYGVRCMRRTTGMSAPVVDTTPNSNLNRLYFVPSVGNTAAETRTSNTITIYSVTQPVNVTISGGTNAQFSKNGAAFTSTPTTVTNGDTLALRATSPAASMEETVTLNIGSASTTWRVRTAGNNTIRVFTTSAVVANGNLGGIGGADATCTTRAAAANLPGNWVAVMSGSELQNLSDRLPWNWNTLKNMNGQTVASGLADFLDGSISAGMNYSETGAVTAASSIWTGLSTAAVGRHEASSGVLTCNYWTATGTTADYGNSSATTGGAYFKTGTTVSCSGATYRLLCMETNAVGTDVDPDAVSLQPKVSFTPGGTGNSGTVTVLGVTDAVTVTITPSAGTANIIKNGSSVGATTTTAGLNETLAFTLTAPAVLGTRNTATIAIGPDTYTWWVGYADSTRVAKAFVTSVSGTYFHGVGGLTGADAMCTTLANESPYGLSGSFKAIVSDSATNAIDRLPWNWGMLQTVTGTNIVDGGINDLWDGSLDNLFNVNEKGSVVTHDVLTATTSAGLKSTNLCANLSGTNGTWSHFPGKVGLTSGSWINHGATISCNNKIGFYCMEDVDTAVVDSTPSINVPYLIQVPTSSRQSSSAVLVGGMSSGATATLSVTATGGTPTFTINGGAEVTSGTVTNGDSLVFKMDAPATGNSNNRMTLSVGGLPISYWRVWTGDTTGTAVKRVFVTNQIGVGVSTNQGGVTGLDTLCQTAATGAALGGTWKAIASSYLESDWAINRIGYNWTTLRRIDGQDVVGAGNIWKTDTISLINPISVSQTGASVTNLYVKTGTKPDGTAHWKTSNGQCFNYTYYTASNVSVNSIVNGSTNVINSGWINNETYSSDIAGYFCDGDHITRLYCIEQ